MTFKESAQKILKESSKPLSATEIVQIALELKILETSGDTPEATMGAILYSDIKNNAKSPFQKIGKGKFALRNQKESASDPLLIVKRQNELVRRELRSRLDKMDDSQFEYLVADLLSKMEYEDVEVTGRSGDEGVDIRAVLTAGGLTSVPTVIQVKQYRKSSIGPNYIRELRGSAKVGERGLIVTLSNFSKGAIEESKASGKMPVSLVDGERLLDLLIKNKVGVNEESLVIRSIDDDYFTTEEPEDDKIINHGKFKVMWPLPGGGDKYIETLNRLLGEIEGGNNSQKRLIQWFIKSYEDVESEKTSQSYLRVPRYIGLISISKGKVSLTKEGRIYYKNKSLDFLFELMKKNILAFEDVYGFIESSEIPVTESEVLEFLQENFNISWKTNAQVNFRVRWMINLGVIEKTDGGYIKS